MIQMVDPVEATSRLQVQLRSKKRPSRFRGATSKGDTRKASHKKHKVSSSSSITGCPQLASTRKPALNDGQKNSSYHNTEITESAAATEEPQVIAFFVHVFSIQILSIIQESEYRKMHMHDMATMTLLSCNMTLVTLLLKIGHISHIF